MTITAKRKVDVCCFIYEYYKDIIETYVSDYYIENHWSKLPMNWQSCLQNVTMDQLAEILDFKRSVTKGVISLSLLCVRSIIANIMIPRTSISTNTCLPVPKQKEFLKYFWKNVKLKKRHEIEKMSEACYQTAMRSNCFTIVDIGSGLGHLSRMLSFGYGFKVCTFEANSVLSSSAKELDNSFELILKCKSISHMKRSKIIHINKRIDYDMNWRNFLNIVTEAFNEEQCNVKFGIVGLHPCGNLGSTLLRLYKDCSNIVFINMASCCYMKLTIQPTLNTGFPLSNVCKLKNVNFGYLACEIACHAIENYVKKLENPEDYTKLKIHAFRACLEQILVSLDPKLKHSPVCSVKYDDSLSFTRYCDKIFKNIPGMPDNKVISASEKLINETWKNVAIFYSVRLLFAPLIETVILLDRLLYIEECKSDCEITPLFDCNISPRNHVLSAIKRDK